MREASRLRLLLSLSNKKTTWSESDRHTSLFFVGNNNASELQENLIAMRAIFNHPETMSVTSVQSLLVKRVQ